MKPPTLLYAFLSAFLAVACSGDGEGDGSEADESEAEAESEGAAEGESESEAESESESESEGESESEPAQNDPARFAKEVHAILLAGCGGAGCHDGGGSLVIDGDVDASYASAVAFTNLTSPELSRLLTTPVRNGFIEEGDATYDAILGWIAGTP